MTTQASSSSPKSTDSPAKATKRRTRQVKVTLNQQELEGLDQLVAAADSDRSSVLRGLLNAALSTEIVLENTDKNEKTLENAKDLTESKIVVMEPRSFDEVTHCVKLLQLGTAISVNLTMLEQSEAQRLVDFIAGGTYALNGHQEKIGDPVFLFTSQRFSVTDASDPEVFKAYVSELMSKLEGSASPAALLSEPKTHILEPRASKVEWGKRFKKATPPKKRELSASDVTCESLVDVYSLILSISKKTPVRVSDVFWHLLQASVVDFLGEKEELSQEVDTTRAHAVGEILEGFKRDKNVLSVMEMEGLNIEEDCADDNTIVNFLKLLSVEIVEHRYKETRDLLQLCRKRLGIDYLDRAAAVILAKYFKKIKSQGYQ